MINIIAPSRKSSQQIYIYIYLCISFIISRHTEFILKFMNIGALKAADKINRVRESISGEKYNYINKLNKSDRIARFCISNIFLNLKLSGRTLHSH